MKTIKNISVNDMEKIAKDIANEQTVEWNGVEVIIKRVISLDDALQFVNSVVESCFDEEGAYIPEAKEIVVARNVVEAYTNIRLPSSLPKCYEILYKTDVVQFVEERVSERQLHDILAAIEEKVDYRIDSAIDSLRRQFESLSVSLGDLQENMKGVFDNVSPEEIRKLVDAVANGVDEEKIVRAIMSVKDEKAGAPADVD